MVNGDIALDSSAGVGTGPAGKIIACPAFSLVIKSDHAPCAISELVESDGN